LQTNSALTGVSLAKAYTTNSLLDDTTNAVTIIRESVTPTYTTGTVTSVSSVTSAATVTELGYKLYASAGNIIATFTPNSEEAVATNRQGRVTLYFKYINLDR
jgi:hypothetical protein